MGTVNYLDSILVSEKCQSTYFSCIPAFLFKAAHRRKLLLNSVELLMKVSGTKKPSLEMFRVYLPATFLSQWILVKKHFRLKSIYIYFRILSLGHSSRHDKYRGTIWLRQAPSYLYLGWFHGWWSDPRSHGKSTRKLQEAMEKKWRKNLMKDMEKRGKPFHFQMRKKAKRISISPSPGLWFLHDLSSEGAQIWSGLRMLAGKHMFFRSKDRQW